LARKYLPTRCAIAGRDRRVRAYVADQHPIWLTWITAG
jgi:hypothetical protein